MRYFSLPKSKVGRCRMRFAVCINCWVPPSFLAPLIDQVDQVQVEGMPVEALSLFV